MRKLLKLGTLFVFVIGGVFMVATKETQATSAASNDGLASPRSLFVQNCSRCHGSNGRAQTSLGRRLEADDLTSAEAKGLSTAKIIRTITNGRGKMPSFRKKLTSAQISSLAGYVRSL